ncbi:MAG: hypothetical protein MK097_22090, partial [Dechloromonas sp.]|nr:hypothetical protein [Dechloromonas sp.]
MVVNEQGVSATAGAHRQGREATSLNSGLDGGAGQLAKRIASINEKSSVWRQCRIDSWECNES